MTQYDVDKKVCVTEIMNVTRNICLAKKAHIAQTPWKRVVGLLGRKALPEEGALVIKPCNSIHTFFMAFTIDVLFLDPQNKIVKAIKNMSPNRLSPIVWTSKMVIELPAGRISQTRTQIGDRLEFR